MLFAPSAPFSVDVLFNGKMFGGRRFNMDSILFMLEQLSSVRRSSLETLLISQLHGDALTLAHRTRARVFTLEIFNQERVTRLVLLLKKYGSNSSQVFLVQPFTALSSCVSIAQITWAYPIGHQEGQKQRTR